MAKNSPPVEAPDKMSIEIYCVIAGQPKLVGQMMAAHIKGQDNKETQRTQAEWDKVRDEVMNTVAK
jgi:hypothetical protein